MEAIQDEVAWLGECGGALVGGGFGANRSFLCGAKANEHSETEQR